MHKIGGEILFYEKELAFLKRTFEKLNLNLTIIRKDELIKKHNNLVFDALIKIIGENARFCDFFPFVEEYTLYKVSDVNDCIFIFLELPQTNSENVLIIGPYFHNEINRNKLLENSEKMKLTQNMTRDIEAFYSSVPIIRDEGQFFALVNTFCEFIWGGSEKYNIVDLEHEDASIFVNFSQGRSIRNENESQWKIELMEKRYDFEEKLMQAVSKGQIHKAEQMLSSFSSLAFESRINDDLRNYKNYSIIMNTLLRKAAQEGGVHPIHLDKISSSFAKKIEQISVVSGVKKLMMEMLNDYCRLVRKHSINHFSSLVQRSIIKIESDLTADLSLKELAKLNNVSTSYLSTLFKKETGQTITEYVNNQRINHAKYLLKTTNLQIQTIAQLCGILDLHYFSKLFKKYVGITPKEYREIKSMI